MTAKQPKGFEKLLKKQLTLRQKIMVSFYIILIFFAIGLLFFYRNTYTIDYKIHGTIICSENYSKGQLQTPECPVYAINNYPEICYANHIARKSGMNMIEGTILFNNTSTC